MPSYVALLRAVNLPGHNKVGMADLRELCDGLGFEEARTLLQSGNIVFRTAGGTGPKLEATLRAEAKKRLGLDTDFFVRGEKEWKAIVAGNPFPAQAKSDPGHLVVMFLRDEPGKGTEAALRDSIPGRERVQTLGRHAYIVYPDGIGTSKLTTALIEKKLGTRGTGRNWNTVLKLGALLGALLAALVAGGCARGRAPEPPETFTWSAQPISFSPPPAPWRREAENGGGLLGVRFVLTGGLAECITVASYRLLSERDRRAALRKLIARRPSLTQREFMRELSLARPRTDDPITQGEATASLEVNAALDRALGDYIAGRVGYADLGLQEALHAASSYELTLADILPRIRLRPEQKQAPDNWRIGYERDTTLAGHTAFASDDTLITPERPLLYRMVFWVVNGCPFQAVYQGTPANLPHFDRLVASIQFPDSSDAPEP